MTPTEHVDPVYHMGRTKEETARLLRQAELYEANTIRLLQEAGAAPGVKVLDVGTGAGDVALLAARLVGPSGIVVGVDLDGGVLEMARERARQAGLRNVRFVEGDFRTAELDDDFDLAVGRLVLMYTVDPVEALRSVATRVRSGGAIGFQELQFTDMSEFGVPPFVHQLAGYIVEVVARSGTDASLVGYGLHGTFTRAGLHAPAMWSYTPLGGPEDWAGFELWVNALRSMLPLFEKFGITTAAELDLDTLPTRMRAEVERTGKPIPFGTHVSAWSPKP